MTTLANLSTTKGNNGSSLLQYLIDVNIENDFLIFRIFWNNNQMSFHLLINLQFLKKVVKLILMLFKMILKC